MDGTTHTDGAPHDGTAPTDGALAADVEAAASEDAASLPPPTGSVTTVENLGAFPASRASAGLGWNITPGNEFEFKAVNDVGGTRGRVQCGWSSLEQQSAPPNNTSQGFSFPTECQQALTWAKQYDLELTFVGAYGPPFHTILTLTLTLDAAAAAGATTLSVTFASGVGGDTLATIAFPYDYVSLTTNTFLSPAHSYAGTLISAISLTNATHATLTLASALSAGLAAGTTLNVQEVLYPSPATNSPTDASILAYARYIQYIGTQCAAAGVACDVELWNEPPWPDECWDNRSDCFDTNPGYDEETYGPNWGFVAALQSTTPAAGVTYTWAGPNKSGENTALSAELEQYSGVAYTQPNSAVTTETLHPYGNNPEDEIWNEPCVLQNLAPGADFYSCNLIPSLGSNAVEVVALTLRAQQSNPAGGIRHGISETGLSADEAHKARFDLRQYLGFLADDIEYVEFYRLYDGTTGGVSFIQPTSGLGYTPLQNFTAMAGLVSDLAPIKNAPVVAYAADGTGSGLTTVASYTGTYPLDVVQLVGSRPGAPANSELVAVYQRSSCTGAPCWATLASPALGQVTLTIPSGLTIAKVVDLVTRAPVGFATAGLNVTLDVSDDPVELLLAP